MKNSDYRDYLTSDHWRDKRREYWSSPGTRKSCAVCGEEKFLQLHHRSYVHLWNEPLKHLVALCRLHHEAVHEFLEQGHPGVNLWNAVRKYLEAEGLAKPYRKKRRKPEGKRGRVQRLPGKRGRRKRGKFNRTSVPPPASEVRVFYDPSRIVKGDAA